MMTVIVKTKPMSQAQAQTTDGNTLFLFDYGVGPKFGTSPLNPNGAITFKTAGPAQPLTFTGNVPFVDPNPTTNTPLKIKNKIGSYNYALEFKEQSIPLFLSVTANGVDNGYFLLGGDDVWRVVLTKKSKVATPVNLVNNTGNPSVDFSVNNIATGDSVTVTRVDATRFVVNVGPGAYRAKFEVNATPSKTQPVKSVALQVGGSDEADIFIDP